MIMIATACECLGDSAIGVAGAPPSPETSGIIETVETCGAVDGPGLRYVVFTSGCPLRCLYCHNPETQGRPRGNRTTAGAVLADVLRYKRFLRHGGLTISGGEPMMQPDFVHAIFRGAKEAGIHTALDTSGFLGDRASDEFLDQVDLVLLDIKSGLSETYKEVTGVSLAPTLKFARRLDARATTMWIRFVLVPGLTDGEENIRQIARFVSGLSHVDRVEILPFHKMGEEKVRPGGDLIPAGANSAAKPATDPASGATLRLRGRQSALIE